MEQRPVLIVGGGSIGERHLRCFQRTGRVPVVLCEVRADLRERLTREYGLAQSYATLEAALDQDFSAAVICTPAHLHLSVAQELAERGLPLLIEKPLSTTTDGFETLQRVVVEHAIPVAIAYVLRCHPALQGLKTALETGAYGEPVEVVMTSGQHFPLYRPAYREIYYTRHATGGGAIQDALTHMLNAAEWLVGPIGRLVADAAHCVLDGVDVEDTVHVITRHQRQTGAVLGSFSLNQHQPANESTLTVHCQRGSLRFEAHNSRWLSCTEPGTPWVEQAAFPLERDDLFVRQAEAFLDLVAGTQPALCTLEEGAQTLRVNLAALQSVKEQRWIQL